MSDDPILYSTDTKGVNLAKEGKKQGKNPALQEVDPTSTTLKLQFEKKGRGGKGVTVVRTSAANPPYFKRLMKELKNQLGTGGTYKEQEQGGESVTQLEFQGNCLEKLRPLLSAKGFQLKG